MHINMKYKIHIYIYMYIILLKVQVGSWYSDQFQQKQLNCVGFSNSGVLFSPLFRYFP